MTRSTPRVVVTLAATTADEARTEAEEAARAGADLAEVRFDLWTEGSLANVARLFPSPLPLVATLRSLAEGGQGPDDPAARRERLLELSRWPFAWIDLEADRDRALFPDLPPVPNLGRIVSSHFPSGLASADWARRIREPVPPGCLRKVVARSAIGPLLTELLPALPAPGTEPVVAMTTGPSGPLLRAWARRLGSPIVFAAPPALGPEGRETHPLEPSQVPVDQLRPFLEADPMPPLFGLAGHPVAHTISPQVHARWMADLHRTGLYVPLDFESEPEFVDSLEPLAEWGFRGLNVTHPYKTAAVEAATEVAGGAAACGVANTLTFRDGEVEAENTDLAAALRRLEELRRSGRWAGRALTVVGAGGAARATLAAARALGARATVYARRTEPAVELARTFDADFSRASEARPDALVVHATPAGRAGAGPLEFPLDRLVGPGTHVLDWVYRPEDPTIRQLAESGGGTYEDGRRLLVYQAAASFGVWWGDEPGSGAVGRALREVGCTA